MRIDRFRLDISCSNAAFDPDPAPELVRILRKLTDRIERGGLQDIRAVRDINGNLVGEVSIWVSNDGV